MKLAMNMIVYDETDALKKCLDSFKDYVDGIFVLQTSKNEGTTAILENYNCTYKIDTTCNHVPDKKEIKWLKKFFGWTPTLTEKDSIFIFDTARNKALAMVPKEYDYVMWVDADDVVRGAKYLKESIEKMRETSSTSMFMKYLYEVELDENENIVQVLIEHLRERIVTNDGRYHWVAPIHETLIPKTQEVRQIETKKVDVVHLNKKADPKKTMRRNIIALEHNIYVNKGKDPRTCYYLAKSHYDEHTPEDHKKAETLIFHYLTGEHPSGWAEERSQAYEYLAEIYRERQEYNKAVKAGMNALIEYPRFPSTYLSIAVTYLFMKQYDKAEHWLQVALKVKMPETTLVIEPRTLVARTLELLFKISLEKSKLDEAWSAIMKLGELFPQDKPIQEQIRFLTDLREKRDLTKSFVDVAKKLEADKDLDALSALIHAAPKNIADNPIISEFVKRHQPPKQWPEKSVVIYCGAGYTPWNPEDLKKQTNNFVGGSEEAVIYAAREMVKQGYTVTVYGDPGHEGHYDGVKYLNYFKFNSKDFFDILMIWRAPVMFDVKYNARKAYLWLHDVPNIQDFNENRLSHIDKIFMLSNAHRVLLPDVPDEKIFITSNGFVEETTTPNSNKQYQCIWTSSYDRGLQHLLEMWPAVKKAVPEATLRIFYGWKLFDQFYGNNPERMAWKAKIEKMMTHDGIYHGGRISQRELEEEYKQAGLWVYPTDFYEINCITAIKAQAFGAVPVVVNHAALKETVQFGEKVEGSIWDTDTKKVFTKTFIKAFNEKWDRKTMSDVIKKQYGWDTIVTSWIKEYGSI